MKKQAALTALDNHADPLSVIAIAATRAYAGPIEKMRLAGVPEADIQTFVARHVLEALLDGAAAA